MESFWGHGSEKRVKGSRVEGVCGGLGTGGLGGRRAVWGGGRWGHLGGRALRRGRRAELSCGAAGVAGGGTSCRRGGLFF